MRLKGSEETGVVVTAAQALGQKYFYDIVINGADPVLYPQDELDLVGSGSRSPASWLTDQPLVEASEFGEFLTLLKLRSRLSDVLYSFLSSRTIFRVYQFKPVLKFLTSPYQRLLIADEVGLGKTIEAGLIWAELDARMATDRVLIVCPGALRRKWQMEMERRFDRDVALIDSSTQLNDLLQRVVRQPETARFAAVGGLEMLRQESNLRHLREVSPTFDLVVVDEAHHMRNTGTLSYQLGEFLSEAADYLIFLTATPLNLGEPDLFNLMHLLLPEEFDNQEVFKALLEPNQWVTAALRKLRDGFPPDTKSALKYLRRVEMTSQAGRFVRNPYYKEVVDELQRNPITSRRQVVDLERRITNLNTLAYVFNRTRKRDLAEKLAIRTAWRVEVSWTEQEWALYEAVRRNVLDRFRRSKPTGRIPGFATVMPERQASSCLPALADYFLEAIRTKQIAADFSEGEEDFEDESPLVNTSLDLREETDALTNLASSASALGGLDSKYDALAGSLDSIFQHSPNAQVLIFSFFRRTLAYLERRLNDSGIGVRRMDGGTPRSERESLMEGFRNGEFQILLSSEVGAEGLDFEYCQYLFNYDLPWNPMRLEQRIGRLDRFGQLHERIFIGNFHIPGTIDTDIFERLYERIGIFERSVGELEPILGPALREIQQNVVVADLSSDERRREADRIAHGVELRAADLEEYEIERERLVGQDEYIVEQLDDIAKNRRYVTSDEVQRVFTGFLKRVVGRPHRLQPDPHDSRVYFFTANPRFGELLRTHVGVSDPAVVLLMNFLDAGSGVRVTFDPEAAYQRKAEFLNFRHPFIRMIVDYYEKGREHLHRAGQLQIQHEQSGDFLFFLFSLQATGLVPRHSLFSVAVNLNTGEIDEEVSERIIPALSDDATSTPERHPILLTEVVEECYSIALNHAIARRENLKDELVRTNEALAVARQESLIQSRDLRLARVEDLLEKATESRIRRMRESQAQNIAQRIQAKLEVLDKQKAVTVSVAALAGGYASAVSDTPAP